MKHLRHYIAARKADRIRQEQIALKLEDLTDKGLLDRVLEDQDSPKTSHKHLDVIVSPMRHVRV